MDRKKRNSVEVPTDSLQLAAALVWAGKTSKGNHFVCLDRRLRDAARKEGFTLMPSELPE